MTKYISTELLLSLHYQMLHLGKRKSYFLL